MKTKEITRGLEGGLMRGLSSFEARVLALLLLLTLVFPTISRASDNTSSLIVEIVSKDAFIRGGDFTLAAVISGDQNITMRWHLPVGLTVLNGSLESPCSGDCINELSVSVETNSTLGPHDIGVEIEYE